MLYIYIYICIFLSIYIYVSRCMYIIQYIYILYTQINLVASAEIMQRNMEKTMQHEMDMETVIIQGFP